MTPNKLALCGDWHRDLPWSLNAVHWAARQHDVDTILHVGDFGYDFSGDFLYELNKKLKSLNVMLYFVEGNHDSSDFLRGYSIDATTGFREIRSNILHIPRGHRWEWSGVSFLGIGGAVSVDKARRVEGVSWWRDEVISYSEAQRAIDGGRADVILSHDCPAGVDIPDLSKTSHWFPVEQIRESDAHRQQLRAIVDAVQPSSLYCGHYHKRHDEMLNATQVRILHCNGSSMAENMYITRIDRIAE